VQLNSKLIAEWQILALAVENFAAQMPHDPEYQQFKQNNAFNKNLQQRCTFSAAFGHGNNKTFVFMHVCCKY
jgi:hypothetical protein